MDYEEEKGFMFAHTYGLDTDELIEIIAREILKLDLPEGDRKYKLNINVVKTKKNNKLGYSFLWINNIKIFNALMGLNFDGSERTELIEDEEDEPLTLTGTNWGDTTSKIEYKHLEPLISFPPVKLNEEDQKILEERKVKALEKIANILDSFTIWFEDINKEEWSNRAQYYLSEFHKQYIEEKE